MTAEKFITLPLDKKLNYLWDNGECVHQRTTKQGQTLCIFSVDGYFVEAIYSKRDNQVLKMRFMKEYVVWSAYVERFLHQRFNMN